ncbi:glycine zipper 2TM domain-containing protein [Sulfuricurvum sp.]|uniref:glycine zipper 2TM domain-containing protein n=1 Tax=Sulfuricurvum sp. TaxID=2025608 RepID=UPI002D55FDEE|nr:glycine zipper 2TM domain-containing protein [Sulfuricurvum sp.]HZF71418.1 glycine zipper 2TM domain-containing protein [Sulfuricurvum sp.]
MSSLSISRLALVLLCTGSAVMADSFSTVEYVKVSQSTPIMTTIQEQVPGEKCYDVQEQVSSGGGGGNSVVGAVAGGALGGVLGHQIGGGTGKTVATVGGAILGTLAGQNVANNYGGNTPATYRTVRRCETVNTVRTRQVLGGYTNIARYKGKEISVESSEPLRQIPVTVTYSY